jgi:hypothetical protein
VFTGSDHDVQESKKQERAPADFSDCDADIDEEEETCAEESDDQRAGAKQHRKVMIRSPLPCGSSSCVLDRAAQPPGVERR